MYCPYCQSPVLEDSASCPRCGLTMEKANAFFGTPPRLDAGVCDPAGVLAAGSQRRLRRAVDAFARKFPQLGFTAAFMTLPPDTPGPAYTMWLFNRSNPAPALQTGSENRQVLLLADTAQGAAWMTVGYGLEPFVGTRHLQKCLAAADAHFAAGRWAEGALAALAELEVVLGEIITSLPRIFGLHTTPAAAPAA